MSLRKFLVFGVGRFVPDRSWIQIKFVQWFGHFANLKNPQTFNEKLQWIKLYDRRPEYTMMVDKYEVKKYVAEQIGDEYVIPLLGGPWENFEEINFDKLPQQFVLKTTHDCGGVLICKEKSQFDKESAKKFFNQHLKYNYYLTCREWPYKNVRPQIIAEKYMTDGNNAFLPVYKIFCFGGRPKIIQAIQDDKQPNESIDYFDTQWNLLKFRQNFPNSAKSLLKPAKLDEMLKISEVLSAGRCFIRVDLYNINDKVMFSEFTFFSDSGFAKFYPPEWDNILGSWVRLPKEEYK
ncbi:MAG: glycosyltransferase [Neobacillus sp.]|jgi:hypothetical protein|nr:glycosyltransferase [Neobacillus sp.]